MKASWHNAVILLVFSAALCPPAMATPTPGPLSEQQLVRLSYMQGDVRFNRGDGKGPDLNKPWEQAEVNLPIEQGFTLATGDGRAEVEFESGGVIYLAENSVILFEQLTTTDGVPSTKLELVSGTLTTGVQPLPKELFAIEMPDGQYKVVYPESSFMRIDSYLDGMAFTPQANDGSYYYRPGSSAKLLIGKGQTLTYIGGQPARLDGAGQSKAPNAWDEWADARYKARSTAMQSALKASGLSSPIPGLTDLYANGKFSQCSPYGTCWEPLPQSVTPRPASPASARPTAAKPFESQTVAFDTLVSYCPYPIWSTTRAVANTPQQFIALSYEAYLWELQQPWMWSVCHYSSWIHRDNHYVVVRKTRRHHPVRWVRVGKQTGFVPAHPNDQAGKSPVNLKHGIFLVPRPEADPRIERVDFNPNDKVEILNSPPKAFRAGPYPKLAGVAPPEIQAHRLEGAAPDAKSAEAKGRDLRILYDYGKGKFVQSGVEVVGHTSKPVVVASLNSRGGFSAASRGGSSGFGGRFGAADYRGSGSSSRAGGEPSAARSYSGGGASESRGGGSSGLQSSASGGSSGGASAAVAGARSK